MHSNGSRNNHSSPSRVSVITHSTDADRGALIRSGDSEGERALFTSVLTYLKLGFIFLFFES